MIINFYDETTFIYVSSKPADIDPVETAKAGKVVYISGYPNSTSIEVPNYDNSIEVPVFNQESQSWAVCDIFLQKKMYNKSNGNVVDRVLYKEISNYTEIEPPVLNDGDEVIFNKDSETWSYSKKGKNTQEKELKKAKEALKAKVSQHWDSKRIFTVMYGSDSEKVIANSVFQDGVNAWVDTVLYEISIQNFTEQEAYYTYIKGDKKINIPYKDVLMLKNKIGHIRTRYRKFCDFHTGSSFGSLGQIDRLLSIEELNSYDTKEEWKKNEDGVIPADIEPFAITV